ncbi:phosphoribosyltransferase [Archaeoglobales archaeon]|nr:MAG: phosphoribosyltransferase [Archaeoglobales archaeon]
MDQYKKAIPKTLNLKPSSIKFYKGDKLKCVVTTWEYMESLCRKVAEQIIEDGFKADVIVALAKGGWFAGRVLCDLLNVRDLISLNVEHYTGVDEKSIEIKYSIPKEAVDSKNVLIVDDLVNTGLSLNTAKEYVKEFNPKTIKTATLQLLSTSQFIPDYFGEYMEEFAWVIFPWNFIEEMVDITSKVMKANELWSEWDIKWEIYKQFEINPIYLEISQPRRFEEVLEIMHRRGIFEKVVKNGKTFWRLRV